MTFSLYHSSDTHACDFEDGTWVELQSKKIKIGEICDESCNSKSQLLA